MGNVPADAKRAYVAIILLGIVSLLGDVVYEGSRGLVTPYLALLGASAFIIAFAGRFGEFLGYAMRLFSGVLSDKTQAYWVFIFLGYGLIVSIPLLGFTGAWEIAIILIVLERVGKALRAPSRDAVLSIVSRGVGAGKAFGMHELMDQVGAVFGPIIVAGLMLYSNNNYNQTFSFLLLPFLALLAALIYAYTKIGGVKEAKAYQVSKGAQRTWDIKLHNAFYIYTLSVTLSTIGLIPYELILYSAYTILTPEMQWVIPLLYMVIQLVDAPSAFFSGYAYDKFKIKILILPFIISMIPPILTLAGANMLMLIFAAFFFGLVLGMQESVYRAAVSEYAPPFFRGTAYGIFNTAYGVGMLISGTIYGLMVTLGIPITMVILYVVITQILAIILLLKAHLKGRAENVKV